MTYLLAAVQAGLVEAEVIDKGTEDLWLAVLKLVPLALVVDMVTAEELVLFVQNFADFGAECEWTAVTIAASAL